MSSDKFQKEYENGNLGDEIDYVEWSSTLDMFFDTKKRIEILNGS